MLQECFIQDMLDCFHTCITLLKQKNIKEVRNQSTLQYLIHSPSLRIILQILQTVYEWHHNSLLKCLVSFNLLMIWAGRKIQI